MTTKSKRGVQLIGEFCPGSSATNPVYTVYTVPGKVREIKRLWRMLDGADAIEQREILTKLVKMGAAEQDDE